MIALGKMIMWAHIRNGVMSSMLCVIEAYIVSSIKIFKIGVGPLQF